jgi:cellulose synthase operon protein C
MPARVPPRLAGLALAAILGLAACDTAEERAEGHYQRGIAFLAEGETERGLVELRNVFRLNPDHTPARLAYARELRARGDLRGALGQYLRLVEQDRQSAEGHRELAELALELQDFETAETHAERAFLLAPDDPVVRALKATVAFREGDREAALELAESVLAESPDSVPARMITIAERMAARDFVGALARADAAIAAVPEDEGLHLARLAALEQMGDTSGAGAQIRAMAVRFPENAGIRRALIQWHLREGDTAAAEAALRAAAEAEPGAPEGHLSVVQFLLEIEGPAAARAELERLITSEPSSRPFQRALAGLDFAEGRRVEAMAALRALAEEGAAGGEASGDEGGTAADERRDIRVMLARMLIETGETEEAAALIESVLAADATHVEALKLRARNHVAADAPEVAIRDLRAALSQAPRDPEIMTILAMAHEREGRRTLMGERLALAVETSGQGPAESLRYARFLMQEGRSGAAEGVIVDALRRAPQDPELLGMLGRMHLDRGDWSRARQVAGLLRGLAAPAAAEMAAELEAASLQGEGRAEDTVALLEDLAARSGGDLRTRIGLVRARVAAGDLDAAEDEIEALLAEDPANAAARMMRAGLHLLRGEAEAAEAIYRAVIEERPALPEPHQALHALLAGQGRLAEADAALEAGIGATGGDGALRFARAGLLEVMGDFEGAIAIYEDLYARDTADPVLANNLASLLAAHRPDRESLDRAFRIARRLRELPVPQFQDTYGWILARRGEPEEALGYLEPAAAALGQDPLVQFHLGMAYHALGRAEPAREAFGRAVALAGEASPLPQIAEARARIAEIDAAATAQSTAPSDG